LKSSGRGRLDVRKKVSDATRAFYSAKAERYEVVVEDKNVLGGGESSKSELKNWEIDDPYTNVDIFNSYGRFFPEITKSWAESGNTGEKPVKATPDLMVLIDSSSSMTDPSDNMSYAALGGLCAARQYLRKGSSVSVVNFGSVTKVFPFSKDYDDVASRILYFPGGGTELDTKKVFDEISKNSREVDVLLLSDGMIYDYNSVMKGFVEKKNTNRITVVEIPLFGFLGGFSMDDSRFKDEKIKLYSIKKEEDIPELVIGDMHDGGVV
jgi:hypothetical protein